MKQKWVVSKSYNFWGYNPRKLEYTFDTKEEAEIFIEEIKCKDKTVHVEMYQVERRD